MYRYFYTTINIYSHTFCFVYTYTHAVLCWKRWNYSVRNQISLCHGLGAELQISFKIKASVLTGLTQSDISITSLTSSSTLCHHSLYLSHTGLFTIFLKHTKYNAALRLLYWLYPPSRTFSPQDICWLTSLNRHSNFTFKRRPPWPPCLILTPFHTLRRSVIF